MRTRYDFKKMTSLGSDVTALFFTYARNPCGPDGGNFGML
jgi:hypothetical protein